MVGDQVELAAALATIGRAWAGVLPLFTTRTLTESMPTRLKSARDAPPQLQGFVAGSIAFLRTDPASATAAFPVIARDEFRTIVEAVTT